MDAEHADESENDGGERKTTQELLDEIEMLSRLGGMPQDEAQLPWIAPWEHEKEDAAGTPGGGSHFRAMRYAGQMYLASSENRHFEDDIPAVPEPASAALLLAGLGVLAAAAARQRRSGGSA